MSSLCAISTVIRLLESTHLSLQSPALFCSYFILMRYVPLLLGHLKRHFYTFYAPFYILFLMFFFRGMHSLRCKITWVGAWYTLSLKSVGCTKSIGGTGLYPHVIFITVLQTFVCTLLTFSPLTELHESCACILGDVDATGFVLDPRFFAFWCAAMSLIPYLGDSFWWNFWNWHVEGPVVCLFA